MHYIPIIDPGISASEKVGTYPPFDEGVKAGIFIRNESNLPFIGKVSELEEYGLSNLNSIAVDKQRLIIEVKTKQKAYTKRP